jgi:hypothetical protein
MKLRTAIVLLAIGIVVLAAGWYYGTAREPVEQQQAQAEPLMFPDLAPRLQEATKVEIVHAGKPLVIEKQGDVWGLAERGDYPVQGDKLRGMLTGLTELRLAEKRTSDPAEFSKLGLEDPTKPKAESNLIRVLDSGGKPIVELVVGHHRVRTEGNLADAIYVRKPDSEQTWLAEARLQVEAEPQNWLDRDVLNIDPSRIVSVNATHGEQTLEFVRQGDKLVLKSPADHPPLEDYKVDEVGRGLQLLTFTDVKRRDDMPGEKIGESVFTTADGLKVTVTGAHAGNDLWARFDVSGNDKIKAEAEKLEAKVGPWAYEIGSWKEKALLPTMDDVKAPPPPKGAPAASSANPATPAPAAGPAPGAASSSTPAGSK